MDLNQLTLLMVLIWGAVGLALCGLYFRSGRRRMALVYGLPLLYTTVTYLLFTSYELGGRSYTTAPAGRLSVFLLMTGINASLLLALVWERRGRNGA